MVFGFGGGDSDEEKEKKQQEKKDDDGRKTRPGKHGKDDDADDAKPRPGRHGRKDEEDEAGKPSHPGRHGRKDDEDEADKPSRPGRHGRKDENDEVEQPGRPGRHGKKKDDEEDPNEKPDRPGRHGHKDDDVDEAVKPAHGKHGRPGKHGASTEEPPAHGAHAAGGRPDRPNRHDAPEKPTAVPHAAPGGHGQQQQHAAPAHGGAGGGSSGAEVHVKAGESIQDALKKAKPGVTIVLAAGVYNEAIKTRVDGAEGQPITIRGPKEAILKGSDSAGACMEINHDYYTLDGFTICGEIKANCDKAHVRESYREKCLMIRGSREHRSKKDKKGRQYLSSVDGIVVKNMVIRNSGGEGVRLRYFVTNCLFEHNQILCTGCYDFKFGGDQGIKNGEGIYIGTSSKQWEKNFTGEEDKCRDNVVRENYINTHGNECVDVKEGTVDTVIENNYCAGQMDEDSGGIDSRANSTIIRYNKVEGCKGAGIRLGGHKVGNNQFGIACQVYGNELINNEHSGIKVMTEPHQIFKNKISGPGAKYKPFRGDCASKFEQTDENPIGGQMAPPPSVDVEASKWFKELRI